MSEKPTRLEFGKALLDISCGYASLVIAETEDQADLDREKYLQGRETAFAAYNAQAERNAELEERHVRTSAYFAEHLGNWVEDCDALTARIAELEASQRQYDALEDACDKAGEWALRIHLRYPCASTDPIAKAAEIHALCFNARNPDDKEAHDE